MGRVRDLWIILLFLLFFLSAVKKGSAMGVEQKSESYGNIRPFGRLYFVFPLGRADYGEKCGKLDITDINLGARANISDKISLFARLTSKQHSGVVLVSDLSLNVKATDGLVFLLGQTKTRFSMDDSTSADHSLLDDQRASAEEQEKPLKSAVGMISRYTAKNFGLSIGYFGNSIRDAADEDKTMVSQRYYGNLYRDGNSIIHMGINRIEFRNHKDPYSFLDRFGLEFAVNYSFFNLQIEKKYRNFSEPNLFNFIYKNFLSSNARENLEQNRERTNYNESFYIQMNFNLTGESLKYKDGLFGNMDIKKPFGKNGGYGAFGLTFRFAKYDLWMPRGEYREYTAGLNWTPVANMKFSLQYSYLDHEFNISNKTDTGSRKGSLLGFRWKLFF
jgi:hypothetical protein